MAIMNIRKRKLISTLALTLGTYYLCLKQKKERRWCVRPINQNWRNQGDYHNLIKEMRLQDPDMFFNYTKLTIDQFDLLLAWVGPVITKKSFRKAIEPGAQLALTLRHLAAGDSISTLAFAYRIGNSTTCVIINETCAALWNILQPKMLEEPSKESWQRIGEGFQKTWNLPNCVGALDGKHVRISSPYRSGCTYFNYKTFSIVLFALCDYKYCFTYVDIGGYGSQSDGGILKASMFGEKLNNGQLDLPEDAPFPGMAEKKPFYFVDDEAFPLQRELLRPFGGKNLSDPERIYNYRLSRARRCIENAFGILVARFKIFYSTIFKKLYNFIKRQEELLIPRNRRYCTPTFVDNEDNGQLVLGEWRNKVSADAALQPVAELGRRIGTRNAKQSAIAFRNYVKVYVNSEIGSVPWQNDVIN